MRTRFLQYFTASLIFLLGGILEAKSADTLKVNIKVTSDSLTTFKGIGYSITADLSMGGYQAIKNNPSARQDFMKRFIGEAGFRNLVLWGSRWWYDAETGELNQDYMNYIRDAMEYGGIKHLMLNPTEKYHKQGLHTPFYEQLEFQSEIVKALEEEGIDVYASTYKNKPNTNESGTYRQPEDSVALGIKLYRNKLDSMGYEDVKITGPTTVEWHPRNPNENSGGDEYDYQDGDTERYLNAILEDPEVVNSLDAFDKQSYGDGMTTWYADKAREHNKEAWVMLSITETVGANDYDPSIPPIISATLLGDINHGVSIWNTWLSYRLLNGDLSVKPLYHYLKNIGSRFEYGAVTKRCISDPPLPTADMHWNYYNHLDPTNPLKPKISAAACENPDGSWTVGMVNTTGILAQHQIASTIPIDPLQFEIGSVDVTIDELSDTLYAWFSVYKSYSDRIEKVGTAEMRNGAMNITIRPNELLVLKSDSMSNEITGVGNNQIRLSSSVKNYPNPFRDYTTIEYTLSRNSKVEVDIFDISGRQVSRLENREQSAGTHTLSWNGHADNGSRCEAGIYICRFVSGYGNNKNVQYIKLMLLD